ncbi:MAG: tetratricopeptide repeat protein [Chitinophagales bacterium]|nr:tetratricopeptide repeat protein [Bacteroidota bacterium]MCB9043912.1 tetratricopeptide repeat protein [Chitinophagales bacterium]
MFYSNNIKKITALCLSLFFATILWAQTDQDLKLAQQYFARGEYEKAMPIYKKIFEENPDNAYYYQNYFRTLIFVKDYNQAEALAKARLKDKKWRDDPNLNVDLGYLYLQKNEEDKAEGEFKKAIANLDAANLARVYSLANTFGNYDMVSYMIQVYERARDLRNDPTAYAYEMALAYKRLGDFEPMVREYLTFALASNANVQIIKNEFQRYLEDEDKRDFIEAELYKRIQKSDNEILYTELLTWLFIQNKDFDSALIQVKALDRRLNENGQRVFEIAQTALLENMYDTAIEAYQYVIDKGNLSPLYEPARTGLLNAQMQRIENSISYTQEDLLALESNYTVLLNELGRNANTAATMRELAQLYALYIHDVPKSIEILEEVIQMPATKPALRAKCKLDLGDYYIIDGDVWEAALYYMQVDKEFKDDILGEEARFKNAKLAYYNGDFEWAQTQLNVLKASTSELIANDALELSVFIIDNLGMDTSATALQMFADADLLLFQNKYTESLAMLDKLSVQFPGHALADDIIFRKGKIAYQQRQYEKAATYWEDLLQNYASDILTDDALFLLADLYQNHFGDTAKAMEYYQRIIVDFSGSLYTVEARKRYRKLRGDALN